MSDIGSSADALRANNATKFGYQGTEFGEMPDQPGDDFVNDITRAD